MADPKIFSLLDTQTPAIINHPLSFTIGQSGSLFAIASLVLFLFLVADGLAAITMILYALGLRVGTFGEASDANIVKSKKIISGALFALLFSFGLVLFVMAINPDMVTGNVDFTALVVGSTKGTQTTAQPTTKAPASPVPTGSSSEASIRARLNQAGVNINNDPCSATQTTGCTNVAGLPEETIAMVISLKSVCTLSNKNCDVTITGGTEPGHQTHGVGLRPVDLRIISNSDPLYLFIKYNSNSFGQKVSPATGKILCNAQYKWVGSNFMFCDEPVDPNRPSGANHWHVS